MNTVTLTGAQDVYIQKQGDIFKSETGELFILARTSSDEWCAVSLKDGNRWSDDRGIKSAIMGLTFVKRNAKIIIE